MSRDGRKISPVLVTLKAGVIVRDVTNYGSQVSVCRFSTSLTCKHGSHCCYIPYDCLPACNKTRFLRFILV